MRARVEVEDLQRLLREHYMEQFRDQDGNVLDPDEWRDFGEFGRHTIRLWAYGLPIIRAGTGSPEPERS